MIPIKAKFGTGLYRKNLSKQHCKILINRTKQLEEFIEYFNKNKAKQDDLADCYLQAVSYVTNIGKNDTLLT